ncbi:DNA-protecting protein DprA [Desulforhopalus vacuolatus]|uniref:DNA-processing protein DprA n=1 Tax=Desulforhopalus vacuolatus TaxID=40414 RepID=UPI0019624F44|nr:DNA-processing protein DprA [Desulforhopalus vacuolatus]MBM9519160.1 DNA-protecting protein DprA [Desulforhopalus vacuolatus]
MMNDFLTEDTKAIILLCGVFGKNRSEKPLSLTEYSSLVRWLIAVKMRPGNLLQKENISEASMGSGIDKQRLESLLGRGVQLGFAVEEWQRNGIWIISRSDADYPVRYKKHLKDKAPPLLFGVGNRSLLKGGGLGIVGSRNVDQAGESFTRQVAELCAYNRIPVISGGARGVDQISMTAALEAGGVTIGLLAENLLKKSVERSARHAIADGRLLLLSPYHPNARFTVGTAMGRNKLIYAMSDYGLVVSAEHKKGGTWAGAEEELKRKNARSVFVRVGNDVPQGNSKLLDLGAIAWPDSIGPNNFRQQLHELAVNAPGNRPKKDTSLLDFQAARETVPAEELPPVTEVVEEKSTITKPESVVEPEVKTPECPASIYQAVLPVILNKLNSPATAEELAETIDVNKTQLNVWLKKAVDENKLIKLSKPVRYVGRMKAEG